MSTTTQATPSLDCDRCGHTAWWCDCDLVVWVRNPNYQPPKEVQR